MGGVAALKLLLDSHVLVWWLQDDPRLRAAARAAISSSPICISLASFWELGAKQAAGRLSVEEDLFDVASRAGFELLGIEADDVRRANALPAHHSDPFDRMLVAQAQRRRLVLVTSDAKVVRYGGAMLPA